MEDILEIQKKAFLEEGPPSLTKRIDLLKRSIALIETNEKKIIEFREWIDGDDLKLDYSNILAPCKDKILKPDIILIPLLCFDIYGTRLGMGGGIYDRSLPFFKLSDKFGLTLSGQQASHIYKEDHDYPIDGVITEKNVIFFKGKKV